MLEEARDLLSGDVKAIFQIAESNLGALSTVELGPKRHLKIGEFALAVDQAAVCCSSRSGG